MPNNCKSPEMCLLSETCVPCAICPNAKEKAHDRLAPTAGSPSFAVRHRKGEEVVELRVPTGDVEHCWHGMDLETAKRLRHELCEAVDNLEALLDLRKFNAENAGVLAHADEKLTDQ